MLFNSDQEKLNESPNLHRETQWTTRNSNFNNKTKFAVVQKWKTMIVTKAKNNKPLTMNWKFFSTSFVKSWSFSPPYLPLYLQFFFFYELFLVEKNWGKGCFDWFVEKEMGSSLSLVSVIAGLGSWPHLVALGVVIGLFLIISMIGLSTWGSSTLWLSVLNVLYRAVIICL